MAWVGYPVVVYTGYAGGQSLSSTSVVGVLPSGSSVDIEVRLNQTNYPGGTFQAIYSLDGGAPVFTGVMLTADAQGNVSSNFTIDNLTAGNHSLIVEFNSTPAPGHTLYYTPDPIPFTVTLPPGQMQIYTGQVSGQKLNSAASSFSASTSSGTATVQVTLAGTAPNATFQAYYQLDGGGPVATGVMFTSDAQGNATTTFTINNLAPGNHSLSMDINNTSNTIYNSPIPVTFTV